MANGRRRPERTPGIVGYLRCSTEEQAASGLGLEAQRGALEAEASRRAMPLIAVFEDAGISGRSLKRPALKEALDGLERGEGSVLMVAKLDRLTRSARDAYDLMERALREGWALVALDLNVDTSTPAGEMMAGVASVFAQFERRLTSQRTRDALAVKRAQGVRLGRPRTVLAPTRDRIVELRESGLSWRAVANVLNSEGLATGQGGRVWHANTARRIYETDRAA